MNRSAKPASGLKNLKPCIDHSVTATYERDILEKDVKQQITK